MRCDLHKPDIAAALVAAAVVLAASDGCDAKLQMESIVKFAGDTIARLGCISQPGGGEALMNKILYGIAIGVMLQLAATNYHVLYRPATLVSTEVVEDFEASIPEEAQLEEHEPDDVWLVLPTWRSA